LDFHRIRFPLRSGALTLPYAGFVASPTAGNPPLTVWFTDLSLGASARSWDFGDGGTSSARTPYHVFNGFARFGVTQTVSGPAGTHATNQPVATDTNPPTGSIVINGGLAYTPSTNVTLALSAADNSGAVSQMQFSNDETNYSAW
jgi:PKD repeat protein